VAAQRIYNGGHDDDGRGKAGERWRGRRAAARLLLAMTAAVLAGIAIADCGQSTSSSKPPSRPVLPPVRALRAVESATPVLDAAGEEWVPDEYSQGGTLTMTHVAISGTKAPALYQSERVGISAVDVPLVANGSYLVVLYFAEIQPTLPGARTFDVLAQSQQVASVDIARDVGDFVTYHVAFTTEVRDRRLLIEFRALTGLPVLSAIDVQPVDPDIELPATRPVFDDEFNGPAGSLPDPSHWTYDLGPGWDQLADYTDRPANVSLDGQGQLVITARNDGYADPVQGKTYQYTSARVTTEGRFAIGYGLVEARIRVSDHPGVVSTFWALGTDIDVVNWPRSGEIDPAEVRGFKPSVVTQAFHMPCGNADCAIVSDVLMDTSLAAGYHTYAFERAPGVVIYLVDGRETASLTAADIRSESWVFDKPFYLLLNLIVGGVWAGPPPPGAGWPVTMSVDWVRAFR
jgi:beta-glucanase (GH16 family)